MRAAVDVLAEASVRIARTRALNDQASKLARTSEGQASPEFTTLLASAAEQARAGLELVGTVPDSARLYKQVKRVSDGAEALLKINRPSIDSPSNRAVYDAALTSLDVSARRQTAQDVQARLVSLLETSEDELQTHDLWELRSLLHDVPIDIRPRLHSTGGGYSVMRDGVHLWESGLDGTQGSVKLELARVRNELAFRSTAAVRQAIDEALAIDPATATVEQYRHLHALLIHVPLEHRPQLDDVVAAAPDRWKAVVADLGKQGLAASYSSRYANIIFRNLAHDLETANRYLESLAQQPPGLWTNLRVWEVVQRFPDARIRDNAVDTLDWLISSVGGLPEALPAIRSQLQAIDEELVVAGQNPELAGLVAGARQQVQENFDRLAGELNDGYGHFPDYGGLGELISDVRIIRSLQAPEAATKRAVSW
jgi:hypothetical protein